MKKQKFLRFLPINFTLIRICDLGLGSHQSIPFFVSSFLLYFHFLEKEVFLERAKFFVPLTVLSHGHDNDWHRFNDLRCIVKTV